jgi:hypothetical protein
MTVIDQILAEILDDSPKRGDSRPDSPICRPTHVIDNKGNSPNSPDSPPSNIILLFDDRHHCFECDYFGGGYCAKQKFRPVDNIPRRCRDFKSGKQVY